MEKMTWTRPMAVAEQFMPNEYIAACGDKTPPQYKFVCNAGNGMPGGVWQETNGTTGLQSEGQDADDRISYSYRSFSACQETHYVTVANSPVFVTNCYYKAIRAQDVEAVPVLVWRGEDGDNVHACTGLTDIGSLPIVKS